MRTARTWDPEVERSTCRSSWPRSCHVTRKFCRDKDRPSVMGKGRTYLPSYLQSAICTVSANIFSTFSRPNCTQQLYTIQEAQLMLTNPRDAFRGQSRSPNSSIPYVRYSFLLCNSNFVFKTRCFYDIRLHKMSWHWNPGQSSLKVIESGTIR